MKDINLGYVICAFFICTFFCSIGFMLGEYNEKGLAIKAGVAVYQCDPLTGIVEFKYKTSAK